MAAGSSFSTSPPITLQLVSSGEAVKVQGKPDDASTLRRLLNAALELSCAPSELFLRHTCLEWVGEEPVMKIHSEVPQMDVYNAACKKGCHSCGSTFVPSLWIECPGCLDDCARCERCSFGDFGHLGVPEDFIRSELEMPPDRSIPLIPAAEEPHAKEFCPRCMDTILGYPLLDPAALTPTNRAWARRRRTIDYMYLLHDIREAEACSKCCHGKKCHIPWHAKALERDNAELGTGYVRKELAVWDRLLQPARA